MRNAQQQTVRDALHEETRPLVLLRMRRVLYIAIIGLLFSAASDLRFGRSAPVDLIALKLAGCLAQGLCMVLVALVKHASWRASVAVAVLAFTVSCAVVSINGSYTADPLMPTLLLPMMIMGAAMVYPWGTWCQVALVGLTSLLYLPHIGAFGTNLVVSVYSVFAASIYVAATFEHQELKRKAIELLQEGQQAVLERIASDAPLADIARTLLGATLQQAPQLAFGLMLLHKDSRQLRRLASVGLPDDCSEYDVIALGTSIECSALAARSGRRIIAADIASAPQANGKPPPTHGPRSSWAEPILAADHSVLGVVTSYSHAPHVPTEHECGLLTDAARLIGIAIERREARQQLERYVEALDGARIQAERQAKQLQEQAQQLAVARDQALASVRARSQFLANMSHEIRTPLNGIIGTTEILLDSELSPSQREYARILSQCGEHLLGVINDILDLSKIEAGKVEVERVPLDLRALVEDVADLLATHAAQKDIELVTSIPPELALTVKGDPSRLRQVLVNLVGNAIKFTEHGEVVIEARVLRASPAELSVRLSVRDTGIGIPAERQAAVFESFTQADGSTTRTYGGTGLGLTICRQLVHLMGGEIGLDSAPGQGSTFWVDLIFEPVATPPEARLTAVRLAGLHVLIVDDNAINRQILRRTLLGWRCHVVEAASGREALASLEAHLEHDPIDIVLLDMQMPDLDGAETAQRVKADERLMRVPLILLSSIGDLQGGTHGAERLGFAAVITKPVRQSVLLAAILEVLGESAAQPRPPQRTAGPARAAALRVLLVEDNRVNQLVARRLLEKLGCQVDLVDNGRDAVRAVANSLYDIVFMDVQMPQMDGFAATAEIRRRETAGERVPIIAMTAHAMEGDRERCLAAGMDDYVAKPVTLAAFAKAVAGFVDPQAEEPAGVAELEPNAA
jgi:signal transduction histidine kinase/DNA-binding response OmpR family regulator